MLVQFKGSNDRDKFQGVVHGWEEVLAVRTTFGIEKSGRPNKEAWRIHKMADAPTTVHRENKSAA